MNSESAASANDQPEALLRAGFALDLAEPDHLQGRLELGARVVEAARDGAGGELEGHF